ncbi:dihydropteroate synthase [Danxiaibacter flavus]|uniref:dihydropteroate synthase n=1 Tax=Danxiaibacter flavus TaxID=3049108 RepID=A0ABV3ZNB2_9BACT|nr:dihydropteroate synthase [Chitinophagaceae bacterium DXS]
MFTLNCRGRLLTIEKPIIMGIINITPDSFYSASRASSVDAALKQGERMLSEGAAILDIGGQSTRPGSEQSGADEELDRVIPVIEALHKNFPETFLSVDTYFAKVAQLSVEAGAHIVNDISGGILDEAMFDTVASLKCPYICMHMKGDPQTMQQYASYENVTREVLDFFIERIETCRKAGIHDVIVDPGLGFAKKYAHNFELIKNLSAFKILEKPLLIGISRKSTIYKTLNITPEEALNGTTVLNTISLMNGAHILRVHDVKEAREAATLVEKVFFN